MNIHQKRTYLVYTRGIPERILHPGSLFVDPANPLGHEQKRVKQISTYALDEEIEEPISLRISASREWLAGANILELLRGEVGRKKSVEVLIAGDRGRRIQLEQPEAFLNEVILHQKGARSWISEQLSIMRNMSLAERVWNGTAKTPKLWMVTGIQFISNARITDTAFRELTTYLGMTVPVPEPIAALAMIPAFEIEGSKGKTKSSQSISRLLDEKVWAAQFSQVEVKFLKGLDADGPLTRLITLREPVDLKLGGIRGKNHTDETTPTGSEKYAEVSGLHYEKGDQKNTEEDTILDEILDADWELYDTYSQN